MPAARRILSRRPLPVLALTILIGGLAAAGSAEARSFWPFPGRDGANPKACAPHASRFDVPGLWLGHFSGGRWALNRHGDRKVDWRNEYQCFFSARECRAWRAGMKREYATFDGHGTCIALRGGGYPTRPALRGIEARY